MDERVATERSAESVDAESADAEFADAEGSMDTEGSADDGRSEIHDHADRTVRAYYEAIDAGEYDRLAELLDPEFVHDRPDRTLDGRDRFVAFMREERPMTDTEHVVKRTYANRSGRAVRGRLLDAAGDELFGYVDVFTLDAGGRTVTRLETYVSDSD